MTITNEISCARLSCIYFVFVDAMEDERNCSICTNPYDIDTRVPKRLECQHVVCKVCLMNEGGDPFQRCPFCRHEIRNRSELPDDSGRMEILINAEMSNAKLQDLVMRSDEASGFLGNILKENDHTSVEIARKIFGPRMRVVFEKCIAYCGRKDALRDVIGQKTEV